MADTAASVPTIITSPVPGISLELATFLITAIKTKRKFLSKSLSSEDEERLQALKESADDATTAFLVHLRKHVEKIKSKEAVKNEKQQQNIRNAATHCLEFLLTTLSDDKNSFHLRRAALLLSRDILERSSDARAFLNSDGILMSFVSVIQRVDNSNDEELNSMRRIFQQQAIDLIARLSEKYGKLYLKFTVASRLMGEISVASFTRDGEQQRNNNMKTLRKERDVAIERGSKACDTLERMIERADIYFKILVPRYGGFSDRTHISSNESRADISEEPEEKWKGEAEDDDSIDWEEGDDGNQGISGENSHTSLLSDVNHHEAVKQTLSVMQRSSGLIQEGGLAIDLGSSSQNNSTNNNEQVKVRVKLKRLIDSILSSQLCLNRWIHALSHTDGMEERAVEDPTNTAGPVSLVLLAEDKRAVCRSLLKRMLKIKGELELVFKAARAIQAMDDHEQQVLINQNTSPTTAAPVAERKRAWLSSVVVPGKPFIRKKPKCSKFKVIYRRK